MSFTTCRLDTALECRPGDDAAPRNGLWPHQTPDRVLCACRSGVCAFCPSAPAPALLHVLPCPALPCTALPCPALPQRPGGQLGGMVHAGCGQESAVLVPGGGVRADWLIGGRGWGRGRQTATGRIGVHIGLGLHSKAASCRTCYTWFEGVTVATCGYRRLSEGGEEARRHARSRPHGD